ncbi:MAG: trypsin-like peptidase domain-containing protein [Planctomycetota bacterium]|nr:trypsin-like peptidase domain-containing protein [Planctomycetota bacterium]
MNTPWTTNNPRLSPSGHWFPLHGSLRSLLAVALGGILASSLPATPLSAAQDEGFTSIDEAQQLETLYKELIDRVRPAVVGLEVIYPGRGRRSSIAGGSGTIIDLSEGLILTSGHVGRASGLPVRVYLHDGTTLRGETLGQFLDGQEDCGLVRVPPETLSELPAGLVSELELGDSDLVETGDWVLVLGHTHGIETDPWRPPPARIGCITGNHGYVLTMDAPLNSGDSGGATVDLKGRLIGINESCAQHPFENASTAINVAIGHFEDMVNGISGGATLPELGENLRALDSAESTHPIVFQPADLDNGRNDRAMRRVLEEACSEAARWTIRVFNGGEQVAFGIVVTESGLAITKASEVDPRDSEIMVGTPDGQLVMAEPLAIDRTLDLLLMQLPDRRWTPAPLAVDHAEIESGTMVISAGPDPQPISFGITQLDEYESDLSILDKAFLGISFQDFEEGALGALVRGVVGGTAADRAGIARGDVITRIDGREVSGPNGLQAALSTLRAGSVVEVDFFRDGTSMRERVRLGSRAEATDEYESGNDEIRVSRHDTGFGTVIQHDGLVRPEECGSALVNLDGDLVGMNIARNDRTRTFALPIGVIRASVEKMRSGGGRVKVWQAEDPRELQVPSMPLEDCVFRLPATASQIYGPNLRFQPTSSRSRRFSASGFITGLDTTRDEILWVLRDPAPGLYQVRVRQSCAMKYAGTKYVLEVEGARLESAAMPTRGWGDFKDTTIGSIEVPDKEAVVLKIAPLDEPRDTLFLLSEIELVPVRLDGP